MLNFAHAAPALPASAAGVVDVWMIDLDHRPCGRASGLGPAAVQAARHGVARAGLRTILGRYLDIPAAAVELVSAAGGKPRLAAPEARLHANLAHSGRVALVAVARDIEVGVDVERLRPLPQSLEIARRCFPPEELAVVERAPLATRADRFFALWTLKEALVKATGEGLARPLSSFAMAIEANGQARVLRTTNPAERRWTCRHFVPLPGYRGALVACAEAVRLRAFRFEHGGDRSS